MKFDQMPGAENKEPSDAASQSVTKNTWIIKEKQSY